MLLRDLMNSVDMKKANTVTLKAGELPGRLTRAQAAAIRAHGQLPPFKQPTRGNQKQLQRANPKRAASDDTCLQHKKKAVLHDVTNVCCESSYRNCFNATKNQVNHSGGST